MRSFCREKEEQGELGRGPRRRSFEAVGSEEQQKERSGIFAKKFPAKAQLLQGAGGARQTWPGPRRRSFEAAGSEEQQKERSGIFAKKPLQMRSFCRDQKEQGNLAGPPPPKP